MIILAQYGVAMDVYLPLIKRGVVDFAVSADWTPATGDTKVSKDGGADANITTNPSAPGSTTGKWKVPLSATELTAKSILVTIIDSATKAVEDQAILIHTYGNDSAMYPAFPADIQKINGSASGVPGLDRASRAVCVGTVTTGATTTSIPTSSLTPAAGATDQFKGRIVIFDKDTSTANLRGQATDITASTSGGTLTVTALTTAPSNGDTFEIT